MLWILLLISQCAFGFSVAHFVFKTHLDLIIEFIIGIPFGFAFSTFIFYFLSSFFAISVFHILIHIALLLVISIAFITFCNSKITKSRLLSRPNKTIILFLIVSLIFSILIVMPLYYIDPPTFNKSLQYQFHEEFSLINSFYVGVNSGFTNPFKIRHPYCYKCLAKSHWLTALHSAMFLTSFSTHKISIAVPSFLLFYHFCFIYLFFSRTTILKRDIYSILSLIVFLFAGSFGFIRWFWRDPRHDISNDFVYMWSSDKRTLWSHPILQYMFAYRPSLLSLSLIIDIVFIFYKVIYINRSKKDANNKTLNNDSLNSKWNVFLSEDSNKLDKKGITIASLFSGGLYGLTIPTQIEVTISFSIFALSFFMILLITYYDMSQFLFNFLSFIIGFALVLIPQFFILLRFRDCNFPIFTFSKFWQPITSSGRFYGEIVSWYEALGVFAGITIVVSWFYIVYTVFFSSTSSGSMKEEAIFALKFYLPSFLSFLFINQIEFHGESRQNIIAFYPCWMIFASIMFLYTFDSIITSIKLRPMNSPSTARKINQNKTQDNTSQNSNETKNLSNSDDDEDNEIENDDENANESIIDYNLNVHIRLKDNGSLCEESHLEEVQGILIAWFSFFYILSISSAMIGFYRLSPRKSQAYYSDTIILSDWIIKNTKIKSLFYLDPSFEYQDYSAITSLSGRILIYDSSLCKSYYPNSFITPDRSSNLRLTQRLARAGFRQLSYLANDVNSLAVNLTSKTLIPKLKYVINTKNSESKFNFSSTIPNNWRLTFDHGNIQVYERLKN